MNLRLSYVEEYQQSRISAVLKKQEIQKYAMIQHGLTLRTTVDS